MICSFQYLHVSSQLNSIENVHASLLKFVSGFENKSKLALFFHKYFFHLSLKRVIIKPRALIRSK